MKEFNQKGRALIDREERKLEKLRTEQEAFANNMKKVLGSLLKNKDIKESIAGHTLRQGELYRSDPVAARRLSALSQGGFVDLEEGPVTGLDSDLWNRSLDED